MMMMMIIIIIIVIMMMIIIIIIIQAKRSLNFCLNFFRLNCLNFAKTLNVLPYKKKDSEFSSSKFSNDYQTEKKRIIIHIIIIIVMMIKSKKRCYKPCSMFIHSSHNWWSCFRWLASFFLHFFSMCKLCNSVEEKAKLKKIWWEKLTNRNEMLLFFDWNMKKIEI